MAEPKQTINDAFYFDALPDYSTVYHMLVTYSVPKHSTTFYHSVWGNSVFQFWNKEYIKCLAAQIGDVVGNSKVLEVAAGDGMLSHYLRQLGVNIVATDSGEWYTKVAERLVRRRADVEILDAVSAIRKYRPQMVIASWLPYGEPLDMLIFDQLSPSIVLIGETNGCCGSGQFWSKKYWTKLNYRDKYSECDRWNLCRTDYTFGEEIIRKHSSTVFFSKADKGLVGVGEAALKELEDL